MLSAFAIDFAHTGAFFLLASAVGSKGEHRTRATCALKLWMEHSPRSSGGETEQAGRHSLQHPTPTIKSLAFLSKASRPLLGSIETSIRNIYRARKAGKLSARPPLADAAPQYGEMQK